MNEAMVTIPMSVYESNQRLIEKLNQESIKRFIKQECTSLEGNEYAVCLDMKKVNEYLDNKYPERHKVVFRASKASVYMNQERPPIRMTCMNCEHQERSHFGRIRSCPECNGVLVDVWEKDILNKVLENAGYVRVKDMNVNDVLSMSMKELNKVMKELNKTTGFIKG